MWNADDGKVVTKIQARETVNPGDFFSSITALALSRDNKMVAAAVGVRPGRRDGLIISGGRATDVLVWALPSGQEVHSLSGHKGAVTQLAFSPDGKWLASAGTDRVVRLWETATGKQTTAFPMDVARINALAFTPDGKRLAVAGGNNDGPGEVKVWNCSKP